MVRTSLRRLPARQPSARDRPRYPSVAGGHPARSITPSDAVSILDRRDRKRLADRLVRSTTEGVQGWPRINEVLVWLKTSVWPRSLGGAHASSMMPPRTRHQSSENAIRPICLTRKNALFAGHQIGAEIWALLSSIVVTCRLNDVNPVAYLAETITAIIDGHLQSQIEDLMPWRFRKGYHQSVTDDNSARDYSFATGSLF
jgi:hypothetical protein